MNTILKRTIGTAAATTALVATLAACGSSDETSPSATSDAPTMAQSPSMTDSAAASQPFGPGCSALPASGAGSLAQMATEPVATAASGNPLLSTLVTAVTKAGLVDTLNDADALTVFAPTNEAFAKLPPATLDKVLADKEMLTTILTHHVVGSKLDPAQAVGDQTTLNNDTVTVAGDGSKMTIDDASVVCGNITTANATVYVIDTVLMPSGN